MTGVLINAGAVILGAALGALFGRFLSENLRRAAMTALGLCTLYIGVKGSLGALNPLVLIGALVGGAILGTLVDIDGAVARLGEKAQAMAKGRGGTVGEGFVAASLLFCVGAMAVTGSLEAGLRGDNATLLAKSALDFFAAITLASALGIGVALSAVSVLVYQGAIALLAGAVAPLLTPVAVAEMGAAGSLLIVALAFNLLGIAKIKVADLLPAIVIAPVLAMVAGAV
ncbi:MAG TPA: DUF554 domain-containing protein [Candidatus Limnocylindria bacterium]|nr:DUF554 domain-containing protein [Candidatus Limnocylindria bacterium]